MSLKRREFLRWGGAGALWAGCGPVAGLAQWLDPKSPWAEQLLSDEFPFPYDDKVFDCAERVYNVRRSGDDPSVWLTDLNLQVKSGKVLDLKVLVADRREDLGSPRETFAFTGASGPVDLILKGYDAPRLHYQVQYREIGGVWRAQAPRSFKLPQARLDNGGQIQALLIGDDHSFDDAEFTVPPEYAATKISGDYVNDFLRGLRANPKWAPGPPLDVFKSGYSLAAAIAYILAAEDPDFILNLGDTTGIGAAYRWASWGLPAKNQSPAELEYIARTLWLRMRKIYSGLTPNIPLCIVLGNHDGDEAWNPARAFAAAWRQRLFASPDATTYPEGGHPAGNYYAFTYGGDAANQGGAQFIVLDVTGFSGSSEPRRIESWTLGPEQLAWFESVVAQNEHDWSFACGHHVLGGWPAGSTEVEGPSAYGRGPLFTAADYRDYVDPAKVEQVKLTALGQAAGLRGFLYGHDHIFHSRRIGTGLNGRDLYGVCCGSTKYVGETDWWRGALWLKHYGSAFKSAPDFVGPSGITRLTIRRDSAKFEYLSTLRTPFSNISTSASGSVVSGLLMQSPAAAIKADPGSLAFKVEEGKGDPRAQVLKVRNGGGRVLRFRVSPRTAWIKVAQGEGRSWSGWKDVSIEPSASGLAVGAYEGSVQVENLDAAAAPLVVPVTLTVVEPVVYPPLGLAGRRTGLRAILLTWKAHPQNANILKYRLVIEDDKGGTAVRADVDARWLRYLFRGAVSGRAYRISVAAVDVKGREGAPATVAVP